MGGGLVSLDLVAKLGKRLDTQARTMKVLDDYYTGNQPLSFLHPDIQATTRMRLTNLAINWPRIIVGSIEERLDVEGFRLGTNEVADLEMWRIWQANDCDEWSQLGHVDAMVHGRAFVSVWSNPDDDLTPRIAFESGMQVQASYKAGTREIDAVLKVWRDDGVQHAWLYLPNRIEHYAADARPGASTAAIDYRSDGPDIANPLGRPPFVALVNRPRLMDLTGESELADVLPMADAVNKLATDMMVSSEYHAMPRRYITGMEIPRDGAMRTRMDAEVKGALTDAFPGKPWIGGKDVKFGQFPEASLMNFINAIKMLTTQIAAIAGLPPHYLGLSGDNPASADAIRSAESSLIKKAERKQRAFGGSYEQVMRMVMEIRDGTADPAMTDLETIWRDPSTPTPAQKADAAVKLTRGDAPIITRRQAREDLGYSQEQIERMDAEEDRMVGLAATADVRGKVRLAKELMVQDGISQAAAYAAVGLLASAQIQHAPGNSIPTPMPGM